MRLAFHPEAERELNEAISYYEDCRAGLGEEFMQEIYTAIERMLAYPQAWSLLEGNVQRVLTHRFPYGLLYVETAEQIQILAVMKQNPTLPTDSDLLGTDAALRRAAVSAKKLAKQKGTPYVAYKANDKSTKKNHGNIRTS